MNLQQARSLIRVADHPALLEATRSLEQGRTGLEIRTELEKVFDPETCLAIMDCLSCRRRYSQKFSHPERWLLSREAAEQATDSRIAQWRADVMARPKRRTLTEMGCGLGGDSVFLSNHFRVQAIEKCPARSELARYNLSELGADDAVVQNQEIDCSTLDGDVLFVDPARRDGSRLSKPAEWLPPLSDVVDCFRQGRFQTVGVKCAPGLLDRDLPTEPAALYFLSIKGNLKEAFLLLDRDGANFKKIAVLLGDGDDPPLTLCSKGETIPVVSPAVGSYLHNPDPAILRADALDALAERLKAGIVHPRIGYLIGQTACPDRCANSFRITDHFPLNWKQLKRRLLATQWNDYEYLGRGVPFSQPEVRKKLGRLKGKKSRPANRGSVIIYRGETEYIVLLAERCETR